MLTGGNSLFYEVCIIGSGFAGAIIGKCLAEKGIDTVIIESGIDDKLRNTSIVSELSGLDIYENSGPVYYPVAESRTRGLGGTSNQWTCCFTPD